MTALRLTSWLRQVYGKSPNPFLELEMTFARLIAVAFLALSLCGCGALKDDRILGEHPWQPSTFGAKAE